MRGLSVLWSIARTEMLLLVRSWTFRIFSALAVLVSTLVTIAIALPRDTTFFFNRAMSGAFPLLSIKLFNVFLGLISVFVATEFLKRDRKQDTSQVYYTHSFSNATYILGKFLGIFGLVTLLNLFVLLVTGIIHVFFSRAPFAWPPYLLYILFVSLPTVLFMVGLSIFLGSLLRSQAAVTLLALVYAFFVLVVVGPRADFLFDSFAYFTPVMHSDFIGLGNLKDLVLLRGAYLALGLALILGSTVLMRRLRQSSWLNGGAVVLSLALAAAAAVGFGTYAREKSNGRAFRSGLKAQSVAPASLPAMTLDGCDIRLAPRGPALSAEADLTLTNRTAGPIDAILLSLNPGLKVSGVNGPGGSLAFEQNNHMVSIRPGESLLPGRQIKISLAYAGEIDERYCFLDIDDGRYRSALRFWLVSVPKRYAVVKDGFIHLTPECGWYPRAGLPPALMFPKTVKQDFARFSVAVTLPAGMTAISQGAASVAPGRGSERIFTFRPDVSLPQVSLTAGRFVHRSIVVDGTDYSLFTLPGHDGFLPLLSELKDDLPAVIRQVRNEYEGLLGLTYPFKRFALVELPIQISSYGRLWNTAQESVQPEIVFLPERGALCTGADFWSVQRTMLGPGRGGQAPGRGGAAGQRGGPTPAAAAGVRGMAATLSPKDLQRALLTRFVRFNLTELVQGQNALLRAGLFGIRFEVNSESRFGIFPQFVTYAVHFDAPDWPLLDYIIDSYLRGRVSVQSSPGLRLAQTTTVQEDVAKILAERPLSELLADGGRHAWPLAAILEAKSKQLLAVIQARLANKDFDARLIEWLKGLRFQSVPEAAARGFFSGLGNIDLGAEIAQWSKNKGVPGFVFDNLESYRIVDKERQRAQLKFEVANPTDVPGVIKVEFVIRGAVTVRMAAGGPAIAGAGAAAERRFYIVPARTVKTIGLVMDQPATMTTIDTFISRNLPASFLLPFLTTPVQPGAAAFNGEVERPYGGAEPGSSGEYIVDDEDPAFRTPEGERENWLRRFIEKNFPSGADAESEYAQFRGILNPPGQWTPVIMQGFYGRFVRSSYLKRSGTGQSRVTWTANLREAGDYDISFYYTNVLGGGSAAVGGMRGGDMSGRAGLAGGPGGFAGRGGGSGGPMGQRGQGGAQSQMGQRGSPPPAFAGLPARLQPGKKHFIIHHEDGAEEVVVELRDAQPGWNDIGTFRLAAGRNTIELTDRNESVYVLADAVRWVRRKETR